MDARDNLLKGFVVTMRTAKGSLSLQKDKSPSLFLAARYFLNVAGAPSMPDEQLVAKLERFLEETKP